MQFGLAVEHLGHAVAHRANVLDFIRSSSTYEQGDRGTLALR